MSRNTERKLHQLILELASQRILFLPHAVKQMSRPDRMISTSDVRKAIETGEILEYYPEDVRGSSCLILGRAEKERPIHIVCAPKDDYLAVITAYIPNEAHWTDEYRTRIEK